MKYYLVHTHGDYRHTRIFRHTLHPNNSLWECFIKGIGKWKMVYFDMPKNEVELNESTDFIEIRYHYDL